MQAHGKLLPRATTKDSAMNLSRLMIVSMTTSGFILAFLSNNSDVGSVPRSGESGPWTLAPAPLAGQSSWPLDVEHISMSSDSLGWATSNTVRFRLDNGVLRAFDNSLAPLTDIVSVDPSEAWSTDRWPSVSRFGDSKWMEQDLGSSQSTSNPMFLSLAARSSSDVWAVGYLGAIWHFDGIRWFEFPSPTKNTLRDVVLTGTSGWAIGDGATVLQLVDNRWLPVVVPMPGTTVLSTVDAFGTTVWVGGGSEQDKAVLLQYHHGVWDAMALSESVVTSVDLVSENSGWVGGSSMFWISSGNVTRTELPDHVCSGGNRILDIDMLNEEAGWAVGTCGLIMRFGDSGLFPTSSPHTPTPGSTPNSQRIRIFLGRLFGFRH